MVVQSAPQSQRTIVTTRIVLTCAATAREYLMTSNGRFLYSTLALVGTLPFVGAAILTLSGYASLGPIDSVSGLAASYGLAIICFLAGAHWATQLYRGPALSPNLFIVSNVVVLGVWFAYLLAGSAVTIGAQLLAFLVLLALDYRLLGAAVIDAHYFRARLIATLIACPSLLAILLAS